MFRIAAWSSLFVVVLSAPVFVPHANSQDELEPESDHAGDSIDAQRDPAESSSESTEPAAASECALGELGCFRDARGRARSVDAAYAAMRPHRTYPWRALAWQASFLAAGTVWYWSDKKTNSVDWQLDSWRQRFDRSSYRYDTNVYPMNFVFHPMAGSAFYGLARANGVGILPSAAYAFGTSFGWEWGIEFRERVSINDMIVTGPSGVVLGEFFYKLGRYLNSAPGGGSRRNRVSAWTAGFPVAFHDWMNNRPRVATSVARDEYGFSADFWRRFRLSYGYVRANPTDAPNFDLHGVQFEGEIVALPGFLREGESRRWFVDGDRTRFRIQAMFGGGGPAWEIESDVVLLGYHRQRLAPSEHGLRGHSTLVGLDMAYSYRNLGLPRFTDRWSSLHLPGLALEHRFVAGPATIRVATEANVDFSGVHANGYSQWQDAHPANVGKQIVSRERYYFAWGRSVRARVDVTLPYVELGARLHYGFAASREGLSRDQESVTNDAPLHDTMLDIEGTLRVTPWRGLFIESSVLRQRRHSTIDDIRTEHGVVRTMISLGVLR